MQDFDLRRFINGVENDDKNDDGREDKSGKGRTIFFVCCKLKTERERGREKKS